MIGYEAWYIPEPGRGSACPVLVVGVEKSGLFVVWKLIAGIVLERVVEGKNLYVARHE